MCFYQLKDQYEVKQGTMLRKIDDLSNKENFVTDLMVYSDFQIFITGSQLGELIAWKLGGFDEKKVTH